MVISKALEVIGNGEPFVVFHMI